MKYINRIALRHPVTTGYIVLLPLQFFSQDSLIKTHWWLWSYSVLKENKPIALALAQKLYKLLGKNPKIERPAVQKVLSSLKLLRLPTYDELDDHDKWEYTAGQLPQDIAGYHKNKLTQLLSSHITGNTLEAMSGFNSYLLPHLDREVTAHDYSEEMLVRYEFPKRRRLLFDLNSIPKNALEINERSFDYIIFVKGYKYLLNPVTTFREFKRLLRPKGKLIFVESTTAGYSELIKRELKPRLCSQELSLAGFNQQTIQVLPFRDKKTEELLMFNGSI